MPTSICPDCQLPLQDLSTNALQLRHCPTCQGLWLTQQAFAQTCKHAEKEFFSRPHRKPLPATPSYNPTLSPIRYRRCPECQEHMNRMNFARRSGVLIDVCSTHGVWLDHHELERIVQFIQSGGLQFSKQAPASPSARPSSANLSFPAPPAQTRMTAPSKPNASWDIPADLVVEAVGELISSVFDGLG